MPESGCASRTETGDVTDALADLRERIDAVDREILARLNERAELVLDVGRRKHSCGTPVYQPVREREILERLVADNPGPFPGAGLGAVFREIISATRSLEENLKVAYLGPEGTFSHLAARERFGDRVALAGSASITDIFAEVERGKASFGLVPVENTTEGIVTATFDAFADSAEDGLSICGESLLRISNNLMSKSGRREDVRRVASHPQPLAQCRRWLERNLAGVDRIETASTAAAAGLALEDSGVAAIGSAIAAEVYGLETIESAIEDRSDNTTRFLVIGRQKPEPTGDDLTSALFTIRKDEPGALSRLLEPFASRGINLTSIQLRPIAGKPWEYHFFLDFEGHEGEDRVAAALVAASQIANSLRVLGSFPRAESSKAETPPPSSRGL